MDETASPTPSKPFIQYMEFIVAHDAYTGMPDVRNQDGSIQWEAPSNRSSGNHKDTHQRRRAWWQRKAVDLGIDSSGDRWISRTAKANHPTGRKPCKRCGRWMLIQYAYPSKRLINRLRKYDFIEEADLPDQLEPVDEVITRLYDKYADSFLKVAPKLLAAKGVVIPEGFATIEDLSGWVEGTLIPAEPSILSPGAMSNCPDRLDGFHSFNLCCRGSADKGRHSANLRSYVTDRRVFEYWVGGDWIAADRMMGLVRTKLSSEPCSNGHPGPCPADHVGPISLGFVHGPEFQLLCDACNSAKNNRMTLAEVKYLRGQSDRGRAVVSWYASRIWSRAKDLVTTEETALRLSKVMRDNRHTFLSIMERLDKSGQRAFLLYYLGLDFADWTVEFDGLHVAEGKTAYSKQDRTARDSKYSLQQKARRVRVAFQSLEEYWLKPNRNVYDVSSPEVLDLVDEAVSLAASAPEEWRVINSSLGEILGKTGEYFNEEKLRALLAGLPAEPQEYYAARQLLQEAMDLVGNELVKMWNTDRYVRSTEGVD